MCVRTCVRVCMRMCVCVRGLDAVCFRNILSNVLDMAPESGFAIYQTHTYTHTHTYIHTHTHIVIQIAPLSTARTQVVGQQQ